jgi:hypothetical protein
MFHDPAVVKAGSVDGPWPVVLAMSKESGAVVAVASGAVVGEEAASEVDGDWSAEPTVVGTLAIVVGVVPGAAPRLRLISGFTWPPDLDGFLPEYPMPIPTTAARNTAETICHVAQLRRSCKLSPPACGHEMSDGDSACGGAGLDTDIG